MLATVLVGGRHLFSSALIANFICAEVTYPIVSAFMVGEEGTKTKDGGLVG